jgi:ankyrin repeat protein
MAYEDEDGDTPLFTSFRMGSAQCAKILLQRAPTRNTIDKNGWSVLHHAVRMGDVAILRLVLAIPAIELHAVTREGQSIFDIASNMGSVDGQIDELLKGLRELTSDVVNACI